MKKTAPPPASLYDAALQKENERHAYRLRQLKAMQTKLAQLDAHMPAIRAAGLYLYPAELALDSDKAIHVPLPIFGTQGQQRLIELLQTLGFKEVARKDYGSFYSLKLGKAHLRLSFNVDKPRAEAAVKAASTPGPLQPSDAAVPA